MRSSARLIDGIKAALALSAALLTASLPAHGEALASQNGFELGIDPGNASFSVSSTHPGCQGIPFRLRLLRADGGRPDPSQIAMDADGSLCVRPDAGTNAIEIETPMECAALPSRQVEDAFYLPQSYKSEATVNVPPENLLVGFCAGGSRMLVVAWPGSASKVVLRRNGADSSKTVFSSASILGAGRVHVALFDVPGIWHRADLAKAPLEQDLPQQWKRPFDARWVAQLADTASKAPVTYPVEPAPKRKYWRAGMGFFVYPMWFENGTLVMQFNQKAAPKDAIIVYAPEGNPQTPFEFLRSKLSPEERRNLPELASFVDILALPLPPGPPSGWAWACRGRARMEGSIFQVGIQAREKDFLAEHILYRNREGRAPEGKNSNYAEFIARMASQLEKEKSATQGGEASNAYFSSMRQCLDSFDKGYRAALKGKSPEDTLSHLDETVAAFCETIETPGPERLAELRYHLSEMNNVLDRLHVVGAACGPPLREWFLRAAFDCADKPETLPASLRIRQAIREILASRHDETVAKPEKDLR